MTIHRGDRVDTPDGRGTVEYVRMAPPDYCIVAAVSVVLDTKRDRPNYAGTIYPAEQVKPIASGPEYVSSETAYGRTVGYGFALKVF